jgi:hypothetical protein
MLVQVSACKCDACGHVWLKPAVIPTHCAKCHSRQWNKGKAERDEPAQASVTVEHVALSLPPLVHTATLKVPSVLRRVHNKRDCRVYKCGLCAAA